MTLVLRGITLDEEPLSQPLLGRFDERGGSLGRSDDATLTLPDPQRLISRTQAQILHRDGHYWVENISAASAVLHNGRPLSAGMRVMLNDGDELRIGGYVLHAAFEAEAASKTILSGRTVVPRVHDQAAAPAPHLDEAPAKPHSISGKRDTTGPDTSESLWDGFLQGAGIDGSVLPGAPTPQLLSSIGEMLKIAVGGLQRLITIRAQAKNEVLAGMTMIAPRNNNPLKFSPDEAGALQTLLQPPARGFLDGPAALRDALLDLQAHQVGTRAGMQAVLEDVLRRLDPEKLGTLQHRRSMFDFLSPARRRARLWDAYVREYRSLREESEANLQRSFGEVFREAYEAQVHNHDASTVLRTGTGKAAPQTPPRRY